MSHDVLLMQRDCEQSAIFVAAFVSVEIQFLRLVFVIVAVVGLGQHEKREAFLKSRRRHLAFDHFLYGACEFLL